jgi:hypothetical protein
MINKYIIFLGFMLLLIGKPASAQHFNPVYSGNPYLPMNILIDEVMVDYNQQLSNGDEVAVFDITDSGTEICVGVTTVDNASDSKNNLHIIAGADDPTTQVQDGFISGHDILFKIWDSTENKEIVLIKAYFDNNFDQYYTTQGTALAELYAFTYETWTGSVDTLWNNVNNWNFNKIPDLTFDVLIPNDPAGRKFPSVISQDAKCGNLKIEKNARLNIWGTLTVGNNKKIK